MRVLVQFILIYHTLLTFRQTSLLFTQFHINQNKIISADADELLKLTSTIKLFNYNYKKNTRLTVRNLSGQLRWFSK